MRLLAISYMLPPVLAPQGVQIGRLLAHLDMEVATVSGPLDGTGPAIDGETRRTGALAFRLAVPFRPRPSGLAMILARRFVPLFARVPDEFRRWVPRAEAAVAGELGATGFRPDIIASFGEPMSDHLLGLRLKRRLGLPWLAHFSDPWADNPFRGGQLLANAINRIDERHVVAAADRVVFTSAETRDLVMRKYPPAWRAKCAVLPHAFEPELYPVARAKDGPLVVRHLGSFYGRRTPLPLLRALLAIHRRDPSRLAGIRFELVGQTPSWLPLHPAWRAMPAGLVRLAGTVPYRRSLQLMAESDLLLVIEAPDALSVFLPSKLIDYLGAATPILGVVPPGSTAALLRRMGGIVVDPRRPPEVAAGLEEALADARQRRLGPPAPWGDANVRAEFTADRTAAAFAELLRQTARRA